MKAIRDKLNVHPQESSYQKTVSDLAEMVNGFAQGIAGLLVHLHDLFGIDIPSAIVAAYFAPDVEIIEQSFVINDVSTTDGK